MTHSTKITEKTKWHKLRRQLNKNNHDYSPAWDLAIKLIEGRLKDKYINPIRILLDKDIKVGQGFPIVALCCSLIETLAAFKEGKIYNHSYQADLDPNYQYNDSITFFCNYLKTIAPFSNYFDTPDFKALDFYSNVRSPLIHECRTKYNWIIKARKSSSSNVIFEKINNEKIIYRSTLFNQISGTLLPEYFNELRKPENNDLRRRLGRKMDNLYEYGRNQREFPWWAND